MFKHLLVPLDGSILGEGALSHAVMIARSFQSRVTLFHALQPAITDEIACHCVNPLDWQMYSGQASTYLERWRLRLEKAGLTAKSVVMEGDPGSLVADFARQHHVDLITLSGPVLAGAGQWNIGLGRIAREVVEETQTSMMLVPAHLQRGAIEDTVHYRRIMVPLDGSTRAECALPTAVALCSFHDAELVLAHIVCPPEMGGRYPLTREDRDLEKRVVERNRLEARRILTRLQQRLPGRVHTRLLEGRDVAFRLNELIERENTDLVVMSAHGHSGNPQAPYGSVTGQILSYGLTPTIVVQDLAMTDAVRFPPNSQREEVAPIRQLEGSGR
ncbi:MAG: universal stress protein [Thermaerobacterales bacterium]